MKLNKEHLLKPKEVAKYEGLSIATINRRIQRGALSVIRVKSKKGYGKYGFESFIDFRQLSREKQEKFLKDRGLVSASLPTLPVGRTLQKIGEEFNEDQKRKALGKFDLTQLFRIFVRQARRGSKVKARKDFVKNVYPQAYPEIFKIVGPVRWQTIEGWEQILNQAGGDPYSLIDRRGRDKRGETKVIPEQSRILLSSYLSPSAPKMSEAIRTAKTVMAIRGIPDSLSERSYRRHLKQFESVRFDQMVFHRDGEKALHDKCLPFCERDLSALEVGDLVVADGHMLNFEILNPWTGKAKRMILILWYDVASNYPLGWEIMPTENIEAIASALRRSILQLGKIPKVLYLDNGKAFGAKFFTGDLNQAGFRGLFARLGIETIFAWPYHGQTKTIERFFETFGEFERLMPTYTGTSIKAKPPRLKRGEKLHRKIHQKAFGNYIPTLFDAHRFIGASFDEYACRPQSGHLNGRTPLEVFEAGKGPGVDKAQLNFLMMSTAVKTIHRNGILFLSRNYWAPPLYGRKHPVIIRYDFQDLRSMLVYLESGEFLCEARRVEKVHPAARILGTEENQAELKKQIEIKKGLLRQTTASARAFAEAEIVPQICETMKQLGLPESGKAGPERPKAKTDPLDIKFTEAERQKIRREVQELERLQQQFNEEAQLFWRLPNMPDPDRYEKLLELEARGADIPSSERTFMRFYEKSPEYQRVADYFEEFKTKIALIHGGEKTVIKSEG